MSWDVQKWKQHLISHMRIDFQGGDKVMTSNLGGYSNIPIALIFSVILTEIPVRETLTIVV